MSWKWGHPEDPQLSFTVLCACTAVHVVSRCYHPDQSVHLKSCPTAPHLALCPNTGHIKFFTHKWHYLKNNLKKNPILFEVPFSVWTRNSNSTLVSCPVQLSFKSWNKNFVLLETRYTTTWHVWCIFKGVFNTTHFTQQLQVLKLWAWFWSYTMALQWRKAELSRMLTKTLQ